MNNKFMKIKRNRHKISYKIKITNKTQIYLHKNNNNNNNPHHNSHPNNPKSPPIIIHLPSKIFIKHIIIHNINFPKNNFIKELKDQFRIKYI